MIKKRGKGGWHLEGPLQRGGGLDVDCGLCTDYRSGGLVSMAVVTAALYQQAS